MLPVKCTKQLSAATAKNIEWCFRAKAKGPALLMTDKEVEDYSAVGWTVVQCDVSDDAQTDIASLLADRKTLQDRVTN